MVVRAGGLGGQVQDRELAELGQDVGEEVLAGWEAQGAVSAWRTSRAGTFSSRWRPGSRRRIDDVDQSLP
jgi:hypothetical protein